MYPVNFMTTAGRFRSRTSMAMEKITARMGGLVSRFFRKGPTPPKEAPPWPERWMSMMPTDCKKLVLPR